MFKPAEWTHNTNLYEVNIRQYSPEGTFAAFAPHLPRLRNMGVDVLWFMPITPISIEGRQGTLGSYYACSDYTSTNPEFGSVNDFKELVRQAHALGFKVIIDWVANHTGLDHWWTQQHPEYYVRNAQGKFYDKHGWHDVIDLNYYNHQLRAHMIEAMQFWVKECDIDGFRCDMAHLVPLDFWRTARATLDAIKPLFWLAETETISYHEAFDASYTWNWMHQTEKFSKGQINVHGLQQTLDNYRAQFPRAALRLYFTANHDENSWNGTEYEKYGDAALPLAVFSCTWDGLPLIYSGQEMPNKKRLKFFDKDPIAWDGEYALHDFYKVLLELRASNPALRAGDPSVHTARVHTTADDHIFCFSRRKDAHEVLVLLNLSSLDLKFELRNQDIRGQFRNVFNGHALQLPAEKHIELTAWNYLVLEK
ncbi:MAG TPA: alpha-amylase family glycosyl hydrolase [Chitinophagaceae bacterium]|nr:alpha-amylase family glycosyl hydrolase [Chitinophagaceae bacterium]